MRICFFNRKIKIISNCKLCRIVDKSVNIQKFEYFLFLSVSTFTIMLWAIFPLLDAKDNEKVLPLKAW